MRCQANYFLGKQADFFQVVKSNRVLPDDHFLLESEYHFR